MGKIQNKSADNVKNFKKMFIMVYIIIIVASITLTSMFTITRTNYALKSQVISVAAQLNAQMKSNLNSYLSKVEMIGTLVFSEEYMYEYDATSPSNDEYEAIKTENEIANQLYNLSLLENMVDFGIIYSNNHFVGKISNGTISTFGDNLYNDFHSMISHESTSDGWQAGYNGNYKRFYYVKKVNENAILAVSFYTTELDDVFVNSSETENINLHITDENNTIIYSHDLNEVGTKLDDNISSRVNMSEQGTYIDNKYLLAFNNCGNNWEMIQSVPTDVIIHEIKNTRYAIIFVGAIATIISSIITLILLNKIITPVTTMVTTLDDKAHMDLLTGILNKRSFEEYTQEMITSSERTDTKAIILLDIDNFKGVNDTLGHEYGDKVLAGVGDILKRVFNNEDYLGRLGGDEFCVFLNTFDPLTKKHSTYNEFVKEKCNSLCQAFRDNYTGDDNSYKISASIGVAVFPDNGCSFSELYRCADIALYASKKRGKDTFTIYNKYMEDEK